MLTAGAQIYGAVRANGYQLLQLQVGTVVKGNVEATNGTSQGTRIIDGSQVRGRVTLTNNVQFAVEVVFATVGGALRCSGNEPDPVGQDTQANGGKFGQWAGL